MDTTDAMDTQSILERVLATHEAYFDIEQPHEFAGRTFAAYAQFHSETSQYVLVKRAKLWNATTHEHIFFDVRDCLNESAAQDLLEFMKTDALSKVNPNAEHMSSYLTLIAIAGKVDAGAAKVIQKARFRKNFKLGLNGWTDLKMIAIDASDCGIISNACGKESRKTLCAQLGWSKI